MTPFKVIDKHYHDNAYVSILINGQYTGKRQRRHSYGIQEGDVLLRPAGYDASERIQTGRRKVFQY